MDDLIQKVLKKIEEMDSGNYEYDTPKSFKKKTSNSIRYDWMGKIHDVSSIDKNNKKYLTEEDIDSEESDDTSKFQNHVDALKEISKQLKEISVDLAGEYSGIADSIDDYSKNISELSKKLEEQL